MTPLENKTWQVLRTIFDPEIPVSIVDLGLVYNVHEYPGRTINISMTVTTPNCPAAAFIPEQVKEAVLQLESINDVNVQVVFHPQWTREMMSPGAKATLGFT